MQYMYLTANQKVSLSEICSISFDSVVPESAHAAFEKVGTHAVAGYETSDLTRFTIMKFAVRLFSRHMAGWHLYTFFPATWHLYTRQGRAWPPITKSIKRLKIKKFHRDGAGFNKVMSSVLAGLLEFGLVVSFSYVRYTYNSTSLKILSGCIGNIDS